MHVGKAFKPGVPREKKLGKLIFLKKSTMKQVEILVLENLPSERKL
jgi:hypothetical protein